MAVRDLEAFLRQAAANFDPNLDTTPGTPFDTKVIQPLVRRVGLDPFTVDLSTFLVERLRQAYPRLATDDGDNITDLLIKPATLLWDPLVRENTRVRRGQSFADPTTLSLEEADSLGGNFFTPRRTGRFARGRVRLYFAQPQDVSINQNNFFQTQGGLIYFPTAVQAIRTNEMLLNLDTDGLYYFDVNVIAEFPGVAYNVDRGEVTSVANLNATVRVRNLTRFQEGVNEEDAVTYVNRLEQSLGEKSMVTLRGISAKILEAFPEVQRLNVVGFNDPEMQRDVITGGGLGAVITSGTAGSAIDDNEGAARTRRFFTSEADFDLFVGADSGFVLTVISGTTGTESARDFPVRAVFDANTLVLEDQELVRGRTNLSWMLRKNELTLSSIPGGIVQPNTPNGELAVNANEIHVGGVFDVYTRSVGFEESTLSISNLNDDDPILSGTQAEVESTSTVRLFDLTLGTDYQLDDDTYAVIDTAAFEGFSLQVQNGVNAGTYRILSVSQVTGQSPVFTLTPSLSVASGVRVRWRLFDVLNVDLVEPKETRVKGEDLVTTQGSDVITTSSGTNFEEFGVAEGDTLRILTGTAAGDYTVIEDPLSPNFNALRVDRLLPFSSSGVDYSIFRGEPSGLQLPLIRIRSIELLDSSSQPQGSFIPYAKPVDVQSRAFQNPARGVKHEFSNGELGLISASADVATKTFTIVPGQGGLTVFVGGIGSSTITIPGGVYTVDQMVAQLNSLLQPAFGLMEMVGKVDEFRFGFRPMGNGYVALIGGLARAVLMGDTTLRTTADIRSPSVGSWTGLVPTIDVATGLDAVEVAEGRNLGFYGGPFTVNALQSGVSSAAIMIGGDFSVVQAGGGTYFRPEVGRKIRVGARSLGSVRVYFLEPTTFEANADTVFTLDQGDGGVLRFFPDPTLTHQQIPALPEGTTPTDGSSADGGSTFTSLGQDFLLSNINVGDQLIVEKRPLKGSIVLADPIPGLAGLTFVYTLNNGPDRTVVFVQDDPSLNTGEVTRTGMVEQINASAGVNIASIEGGALKLTSELSLVVRTTGTALPFMLGNVDGFTPTRAFTDADTDNSSPHAGTYTISSVGTTTVGVSTAFPTDVNWASPVEEQTFRVLRVGIQRTSTSQMSDQRAEAGLYYADVELISEGAGDAWNISSSLQLTVDGFRSDGYYLTTDDSNLTFSPFEATKLVISRTILENGVDDDPVNATQVTGQNIQITYDRSSTVQNVDDFARSDFERTVCANPLCRHLIPHFVRFDFEYFGGSDEAVVIPDMEAYIRNRFPSDSLNASELQKIASDRGATKVTNPLTLIAVVHRTDRTVQVQRSQDALSTGRLNAFIPDQLNVVRNVNSGL